MLFTDRELWAVIHGMLLGALFLLAFAAGLTGLFRLKAADEERALVPAERPPRLLAGIWVMAIVAWLIVITGTWVLYPWYRAPAPEGADLIAYPRNFLLANPDLSVWHTFGMEWKEHVAWIAPMLATSAAVIVLYYGRRLMHRHELRWTLIGTLTLAFATAGVAGVLGIVITQNAPVY